ncbi:forespore regulator of the sigma-K checkpoint [Thalassobacillus cyri]|uniref:Forespore regulator of the sigma-K checkpoint n=1 Tax=Thalassobacillus cyri TaxID=571932 RepID=A0A1H4FBU4_9BACI|nr:BofC C-terminal domain-containing protein [Thalassobacillus cyri]SEA94641.1 forespore regulator of the sigma-K checkpoint [Thalassobacillus cyri]
MRTIIKSITISMLLLGTIMLAPDADSTIKGSTEKKTSIASEKQTSLVASQPLEVKVTMTKEYLDGVRETEEKVETIWAMEDFWASYTGWTLVDQGDGFVEFKKKIDDLSPEVKANGYFGIDINEQLTIFLGKPAEGQIMESFFPIPVDTLESKRMEELEKGIKIKDKEHFQKVIKTYSGKNMTGKQ